MGVDLPPPASRELDRVEAIIRSMTAEERERPEIIDGSRRARIARGSGRQPQDVQNLLTQFKQMQKMLNNMSGFGTKAIARSQKKRAKKNQKKGKGGGGRTTPKGKNKLVLPDIEKELASLEPRLPGLPR